jgi:hypothetical protein
MMEFAALFPEEEYPLILKQKKVGTHLLFFVEA